jgi:hypothetical protein
LKFNNLFIKFLKTYGKSLIKIIIIIIIICFIFKYFLQHFYYAEIMIFIKLKKTGKIIYILNIYKFIILFNAINKIIKKIINNKIIIITEKYNLLL